jgi:hypothetical protein
VPHEAARGGRPALGRAEQLDQALTGLGVVGAPRGLDHHLCAERDRVHRAPARLAHVDVEVHGRHGGMPAAGGIEHLELGLGRVAHTATARRSSK